MGTEVVGTVKAKYIPTEKVKEECYGLGKKVAEEVLKNIG